MMILDHKDGTKTYLKEAGEPGNEPILLLHGLSADHQMWEPQTEWLASLGYYVLVPDLLGHGESSKMNNLELEDWDNQIQAILAEKGISRCNLIGVSMGGVIAQSFASRYPGTVKKLLLADTFGELKTLQERILARSQLIGFHLYRILGGKALAKGMAAAYNKPYAAKARDYLQQASVKADFEQLILARKAINRADLIGTIDGKAIPTLVLVGRDFGKTFIEINRKIAKSIEGAKFVILEQAMDPSNLVNPEDFNREMLRFLESTP